MIKGLLLKCQSITRQLQINQIRMVKDLLEHMTKRKTLMCHTTYFIGKWHRGPMSY